MKTLLLLFMLSANAPAMDRWTALAMLESGGDDRTVGRAGEISRYQIRRDLWPGGNPLDSRVGLANARQIMSARVAEFERSHGRAPDDFEFYILWHRPACYIGRAVPRPITAVEADRGRRFASLCQQ